MAVATATEPSDNSASKSASDYFKHRTDLPADSVLSNDPTREFPAPKSQTPPQYPKGVPPGSYQLSVAFVIEQNGEVKEAFIMRSSGIAEIDEAHIKAMKRWRYRPAKVKGKAIAMVSMQPFTVLIK
jgi:TonB family protein